MEIWENTKKAIQYALQKVNLNSQDIASIGITNQRETTVVFNKKTGKPYYNAIVWQDTRTKEMVDRLSQFDRGWLSRITGLPPSTYFSLFKLLWILEIFQK